MFAEKGSLHMRSASYRGDRTLAVEDRDPVPPGEGEVRLDVSCTGICGK
jgi:(R,R)-butanediol dehydrogenase / meso-butanediol dehydrogenase / diacetyl reductase